MGGRSYLSLSWSDVVERAERLAQEVSRSYECGAIVGILRGGLVVAVLLSDILGIREVYPMGLRSYRGVERGGEVVVYQQPAHSGIAGRKVLLVDDVSDRGETLRAAQELLLKEPGPSEVKTATLHVKPWTSTLPDYYLEETPSWILYPWSLYENCVEVGRELLRSRGRGEAAKMLSDLLGITDEKAESLITKASRTGYNSIPREEGNKG